MKAKKRALIINFYASPGGAERRFARAFEHLNQNPDNDIELVINKYGKEQLQKIGINISKENVNVIGNSKEFSAFEKIKFLAKLTLLILLKKYSHIHYAIDPSYCSYSHSKLLKLLKTPYSLSILDSNRAREADFSSYTKRIWATSIRNATRIDFLSEGIKNNTLDIFKLIPPHEISPCSFTDYSKSIISESKEYDLVMMCRLHPGKGLELLFSALQEIRRRNQQSLIKKIGIFGRGPLEKYVASEIKNLPEFNIELNYTTNPFDIFSRTKVFLSLQEKENYPSQSILEAASCGAMIIATNVGETYKLVSEENGHLTFPSPNAVAQKIIEGLSQYNSNSFDACRSSESVRKAHTIERFSRYLHDFITRAQYK